MNRPNSAIAAAVPGGCAIAPLGPGTTTTATRADKAAIAAPEMRIGAGRRRHAPRIGASSLDVRCFSGSARRRGPARLRDHIPDNRERRSRKQPRRARGELVASPLVRRCDPSVRQPSGSAIIFPGSISNADHRHPRPDGRLESMARTGRTGRERHRRAERGVADGAAHGPARHRLPILAMLLAGYVAKRSAGRGMPGAQDSGDLGGLGGLGG